jgi:hypothetical protein
MSGPIQKILTKEMTRKEFLSYIGVFMLTLLGISSLLKNLSTLNPRKTRKLTKSSFGRGAYGV